LLTTYMHSKLLEWATKWFWQTLTWLLEAQEYAAAYIATLRSWVVKWVMV
jgi:hypothetical protein